MRPGLYGLIERAQRVHAGRLAVVEPGVSRRYAEFGARVASAAASAARAGWARGVRVAVLAPNTVAFLEAYFAVAGLGAVCVPLNTRLAATELAWILDDAEAVGLLSDTRLADLAHAALAATRRPPAVVWCGPDPAPEGERWEAWCAGPPEGWTPAGVERDQPAQLYYTSGTTGAPKGVVLTAFAEGGPTVKDPHPRNKSARSVVVSL